MDENGRLVTDPELIAARDRARLRRRPGARFARPSETEFAFNPLIRLKSDPDIWSPILNSAVLYSTLPEIEDDLILIDPDAANDFYS